MPQSRRRYLGLCAAPAFLLEESKRAAHRLLAGDLRSGFSVPADVADLLRLRRHEGRVLDALAGVGRHEDIDDGQAVFACEVEVALVVRRAADDGARAVVHQHEVGDVERQLPRRVGRMRDLEAGVEAELFSHLDGGLRRAEMVAERNEIRCCLVAFGEPLSQRMIRGDCCKGRPAHRVGARCVDRQGLEAGWAAPDAEREMEALGAADPVLLHQPDLVRPTVERGERFEQLFAVFGDGQEPLGQLAELHLCAGAPAPAVDHLLVGEHSLVDRVPVHLRGLARDEPGIEEVEEETLLLRVIFNVAGGELATPVERQAHRLQLRAHRRDVVVGPGLRMHLVLRRGVLRR